MLQDSPPSGGLAVLAEAFRARRTGVLVEPGDPDALAAAIKSLLADPERCARMGAAASEHIRREFTWERTARETVGLYELVVSG